MRVSRIGCLASIVISVASSLILTVISRPDHLVAATTHDCFGSTRPDCQSNIDNNRCRGDRPPPGRDHRQVRHAQPRHIRGSLYADTDNPNPDSNRESSR